MINNVGIQDRLIRLTIGLFFIALGMGITNTMSVTGILLLLVGLILAVTGGVGMCPLYKVFGLDTCKAN